MKGIKKLLIYLAFVVGIIIVLLLICFAVMYFSPGTSIFGYEYALYNKKVVYKYTSENMSDLTGINAFEIVTNITDINILPNTEDGQVKVIHTQGLSGFTKSKNAKLNYDVKIETKSFEESETNYKTFCLKITEPTGWIAKNGAKVNVYVPYNFTTNTIYAKSNQGNVSYYCGDSSAAEPKLLTCTSLYLKTGEYGKISVNNDQSISNYYFTTDYGVVSLKGTSEIIAYNMKFETKTGTFNFTNADENATIRLNNNNAFVVKSYDRNGPTIKINNLYAYLKVEAQNGYYKIDNIGTASARKQVTMTLNKSNVVFGKVYAYVSILGDGSDVANNISIQNLYSNTSASVIESGAGNVKIENLSGNLSVDATSGKVDIKQATVASNVYVYTDSGDVNVKYASSSTVTDGTKLTVLTKTGNINLTNISCVIDIQVLAKSSSSSLNLIFTAVAANNDNIINAKDRKIKITLKGVSDYLQCRILATQDNVGLTEIVTRIAETDEDYELASSYSDYSYRYRVGYSKSDSNYNSHAYDLWGKLLIATSGSVQVLVDLS